MRTARRTAVAAAVRSSVLLGLLGLGVQAHAAVHALLIGITDYKAAQISDLQGPANDIRLMNDVLLDRFKVPKDNITLLPNGTHSQIRTAFDNLTKRVRKGDQVYIHYSGHGSWYKSPNPAERRGQDQTWVSHGARAPGSQGDDAHDVLDKELGTWMMALHAVTDDVVLVSDSCHSASMTRDVQVGARSSDGVLQPHPLRDKFKKEIVYPEDAGLRIGAARDIESAVELDPEHNTRCSDPERCYGVFTWNWAQALKASRPGESWGDVYDRTLAAIEANPLVLQRPQKDGNAGRAVFEGKFAPLTHTVPVQKVEGNGTVLLGAGRLSGLTVGSELAGVVPEGTSAPRLKVTSVAASTAQATLLEGKVKEGGQLKVSRYQEVEPRITLHVGGPQAAGVDVALAGQVKKAIEQARGMTLQSFDLVDKPEAAQWRLTLVRPKNAAAAQTASLPEHVQCAAQPCTGTELWVVNPFGQLMHPKMRFPMSDPDAQIPRLLGNLGAFSKAQEVRAIARQGNATPMAVQVTVLRPPAGSSEACTLGANGAAGWQKVLTKPLSQLASADIRFNDCLAFTIENKDKKPWYGYVLSVDPNFRINRVWPTAKMSEDEARIEHNTTHVVNNSHYRLNAPGKETFLFIASEQQTPMGGLTEGGMRGTGPNSPLARLSRMGVLTRGVEGDTEEGPWGAQSVTLEVAAAR
jgi:hypothetical protein